MDETSKPEDTASGRTTIKRKRDECFVENRSSKEIKRSETQDSELDVATQGNQDVSDEHQADDQSKSLQEKAESALEESPIVQSLEKHLGGHLWKADAGEMLRFEPSAPRCQILDIPLTRRRFANWTLWKYYSCPKCADIVWSWSLVSGFCCLQCRQLLYVDQQYRDRSFAIAQNRKASGASIATFLESVKNDLVAKNMFGKLMFAYKKDIYNLLWAKRSSVEHMSQKIHVRHILIKHNGSKNRISRRTYREVNISKEEAKKEMEQIKISIGREDDAETSFSEYAKRRSDCSSCKNRGDIGFINVEVLFQTTLPDLARGEMSDTFHTPSGYHLILRIE